jgi:outer membrane lipoprotein carrier protein
MSREKVERIPTVSAVVIAFSLTLLAPSSLAADRLDEILAAMKAAGDKLSTLQARFDQTDHDFILDEEEATSGRLCLKIPGHIRWEYDPPTRRVLLIKGDKIQLYLPTANQVQEFKKGQMRGGGADLLIGFGKSNAEIGKNYNVSLVEETATSAVLKLVPKPDSSASIFTAIELTMDKGKWIPIRSVFHEPNRDTTEILFKDIEINTSLPAKSFELDLPGNVEIVRNQTR